MSKSLVEMVESSDQIVIGIGDEWNWVRRGIKSDPRYEQLINLCSDEEYKWLLPIVEFEYAYYNSDSRIEEAYRLLRKLVGDKKYFLVCDTVFQDALLYGFDPAKSVYPCGNLMYLQTPDLNDPLIFSEKSIEFMQLVADIHDIISIGGIIDDTKTFVKPFQDGKELYLNQKRKEYSNIAYNETAYMENWDVYKKFLTHTLNSKLLILELGVGLDYPTVVRWPFEKIAFVNNKAHLVRVHEKLYHHTPEIEAKTDSIPMNSVDYILQECKGL
ncbi:hypothetical protein SAMN02910275_02151 [Butyrivibrio sp. INlla18]|uniref:hypothetical protein n=1 Tax=Butyrivibrio sp. INlla18 TaxID=1520806 RepID=UPI00088890C4|nr:hypothetical protein [Butyrivibrio sp. INlla18]SDA68687.1 hypothetical protein SAMN02910275_02151 [Butyrivibrio sp. INlla18]